MKLKTILEKITKDDIRNLDSNNTQELEDFYYGIGDNIYNLETELQKASKHNPKFKEELKIYQQMIKLFNKSELGKYL